MFARRCGKGPQGRGSIIFDHECAPCTDSRYHRYCRGRWRGVLSKGSGPDGRRRRYKVARRAGISKTVTPHTLRHAFITAALDAGVPLRDVQEAASHADPRTTMRYDRARGSLDRHATYIVAAYVAGAAR